MSLRRIPRWAAVAGLAVGLAAPLGAQADPLAQDSPPDPHIRKILYDPDRVVALNSWDGFQMMVQFGGEERIKTVAVGEGSGWQVTPNKEATLLFLKPLAQASETNMTVVTDQRSYLFELVPHAGRPPFDLAYAVRFTYPAAAPVAAPAPPPPPERRNARYTYTGDRALLPSEVFDDGRFTYFRWPEGAPAPAVFVLTSEGGEGIVNSGWREGYQVVEQLAPRFRLRDGKSVTTLINEGWRPPSPGVEAPRPHDARTARAAKTGAAPP